jgi:hypothetical protein
MRKRPLCDVAVPGRDAVDIACRACALACRRAAAVAAGESREVIDLAPACGVEPLVHVPYPVNARPKVMSKCSVY